VTYLPVSPDGRISLAELEAAIRPDTALVSVMAVNNEIGVRQPLADIGALCRANKVFFHTDAAQAVGKVPVDVNDQKIDLMSISGHKIYGPKGVGALYVRRRPRVRLEAQMSGGGQERGLRSGTVPASLVVGLGAACSVAAREMAADEAHVRRLEARLREGITSRLTGVQLNGPDDLAHRYPGNVNLSFAYVEGESLIMGLKVGRGVGCEGETRADILCAAQAYLPAGSVSWFLPIVPEPSSPHHPSHPKPLHPSRTSPSPAAPPAPARP
jgi:cysteine desulfurase